MLAVQYDHSPAKERCNLVVLAGGFAASLCIMRNYDDVDRELLRALVDDPRATVVALSDRLGLARNTVSSRLAKLESDDRLLSFDRRIAAPLLGYPLAAFSLVRLPQKGIEPIIRDIAEIPEVVHVNGISGAADLLVHLVARDAEDLFRVDAEILAIDGIERTETSLSMGELLPYRVQPLLDRDRSKHA